MGRVVEWDGHGSIKFSDRSGWCWRETSVPSSLADHWLVCPICQYRIYHPAWRGRCRCGAIYEINLERSRYDTHISQVAFYHNVPTPIKTRTTIKKPDPALQRAIKRARDVGLAPAYFSCYGIWGVRFGDPENLGFMVRYVQKCSPEGFEPHVTLEVTVVEETREMIAEGIPVRRTGKVLSHWNMTAMTAALISQHWVESRLFGKTPGGHTVEMVLRAIWACQQLYPPPKIETQRYSMVRYHGPVIMAGEGQYLDLGHLVLSENVSRHNNTYHTGESDSRTVLVRDIKTERVVKKIRIRKKVVHGWRALLSEERGQVCGGLTWIATWLGLATGMTIGWDTPDGVAGKFLFLVILYLPAALVYAWVSSTTREE